MDGIDVNLARLRTAVARARGVQRQPPSPLSVTATTMTDQETERVVGGSAAEGAWVALFRRLLGR